MVRDPSSVKLEQAMERLEKELKAKSLRVEAAADRVLVWGRKTEFEDQDRYRIMRAKENRLLRLAGNMIYRRSMRRISEGKKSQPGTHKRLAAVGSHLYDMARWVLPVLEYSSPVTYKQALKQLLTDEISEYSAWNNEFDKNDYLPSYILELFGRAEKLGMNTPLEIRQKCERAFDIRPTVNQLFGMLGSLVRDYWDKELAYVLQRKWGDKKLWDSSIQEDLISKSTTLPEKRIKDWLRSTRGFSDNQLKVPGGRLLGFAAQHGFFKTSIEENLPLSDFLQGYLKIRNEAHHQSLEGTRATIDVIILTNKILNMIESQVRYLKGPS
jgi:hypothetical protein